jgi:hypothetical protein
MQNMIAKILHPIMVARLFAIGGQLQAAGTLANPNILFFISDQWRVQALGYGDDPSMRTPHLNALHATGDKFFARNACLKEWSYTVDKTGTVPYTI